MGTGWYREPYYPPDALIDRRSVGELAEVMIREFEEGGPGSEERTGRVSDPGSSARSGPTSRGSALRRSGSSAPVAARRG